MGVVTGLLLLPVTGPVRVFRAFLEQLRDEAEAVLRDEGRAFAELIDLSMRHNTGQLADTEYAEQEKALLDRLNAIREYRNELLQQQADEVADEDADDEEDWPNAALDEDGQDSLPFLEVGDDEEDWSASATLDEDDDEEDWR